MAKDLVALGLLVAVIGVATTAVATAQDDPTPPATSTELVRGVSLYQGKSVRWWARRAVQARKDANARGLTIKRLRSQNRRLVRRLQAAVPFFPIGVWDALADRCESKGGRGQWHTYLTTGNGFYFRLQFHPGHLERLPRRVPDRALLPCPPPTAEPRDADRRRRTRAREAGLGRVAGLLIEAGVPMSLCRGVGEPAVTGSAPPPSREDVRALGPAGAPLASPFTVRPYPCVPTTITSHG